MDDRAPARVSMRIWAIGVAAALTAVVACRHSGRPAKRFADSVTATARVEDSAAIAESLGVPPPDTTGRPTTPAPARTPTTPPPPQLSAPADSVAQLIVFVPTTQTWFVVASRGKRVLLDLGRVDADLKKPHRRSAYLEAVRKLSPVPIGARFRLFSQYGTSDVVIKGFDVWNSRVVATLTTPHAIDSIARAAPLFVASAELIDSTRGDSIQRADSVRHADAARTDSTPADTCRRGNVPDSLRARVLAVRDSLITWLESLPPPPYERLVKTEKPQWSTIVGCFGGPRRIALAVDLRAGNNEWIRERIVLIDTVGAVTSLRVSDLRFKGHDLLLALDADGDGLDDLATRGFAEASGGITILKLTDKNRLQRLANGFAWEAR